MHSFINTCNKSVLKRINIRTEVTVFMSKQPLTAPEVHTKFREIRYAIM